jgi:hypothetical protein
MLYFSKKLAITLLKRWHIDCQLAISLTLTYQYALSNIRNELINYADTPSSFAAKFEQNKLTDDI